MGVSEIVVCNFVDVNTVIESDLCETDDAGTADAVVLFVLGYSLSL